MAFVLGGDVVDERGVCFVDVEVVIGEDDHVVVCVFDLVVFGHLVSGHDVCLVIG